jgi:hypothetical protein
MVEQLFGKTTPIVVPGTEKKYDLHRLPTQDENPSSLNLHGINVPNIATDGGRLLAMNSANADLQRIAVIIDDRQIITDDWRMTTELRCNAKRRSILTSDCNIPVASHIRRSTGKAKI